MCRVWGNCIHIGVGFCVARSTRLGNARALISGMSNGYRLSRLNRILQNINLIIKY